jgi:Domain of unknown function (DUF5615)
VKIRFQADADLKHAILAGTLRRALAVDFQRAEGVPLEGLDDPVVLATAAEHGRVLVSHDVNTMEVHFREFTSKQTSPGLILIPQKRVSIGKAIESLVLLWEVLDAADLENRVCLFPSLIIY